MLDILKIINHPDYQPNQDPGVGGPLEGNDISVYLVDDSQFKMGNNTKYDTFSSFPNSIKSEGYLLPRSAPAPAQDG